MVYFGQFYFGQLLLWPVVLWPVLLWCAVWAHTSPGPPCVRRTPFLGPDPPVGPPAGLLRDPLRDPKFRLFFSLSRSPFPLFFLSLGVFSWNFDGVFEGRDPEMCTFGLSGCHVKPRRPSLLLAPFPPPPLPPPPGPPPRPKAPKTQTSQK